jgi:hypothetical protein
VKGPAREWQHEGRGYQLQEAVPIDGVGQLDVGEVGSADPPDSPSPPLLHPPEPDAARIEPPASKRRKVTLESGDMLRRRTQDVFLDLQRE